MARQTVKELHTQIAELTGKLRGQIAHANRLFERCSMLELENRELKLILRQNNIEYRSALPTLMAGAKARFELLADQHGRSNVRIHGGRLEVREDYKSEWTEVTA